MDRPLLFLRTSQYLLFRLNLFSRITCSAVVATLGTLNTFLSTAENPPTCWPTVSHGVSIQMGFQYIYLKPSLSSVPLIQILSTEIEYIKRMGSEY